MEAGELDVVGWVGLGAQVQHMDLGRPGYTCMLKMEHDWRVTGTHCI